MESDSLFRAEQRRTVIRMALALAVTGATLTIAWRLGGVAVPPDSEERLRLAAVAGLVPAFWLAAAIGNVARRRLISPEAIGGGDAASLAGPRAILGNTLEQAALAFPVWLAVSMSAGRPTSLLVALAGLFSLGRLLFWSGWRRGAAARAFGFGLTFYPTVAMLAVTVWAALT